LKRIYFALAVVLGLFLSFIFISRSQTALAETNTQNVSGDAWVSSQFPAQNYGSAAQLYLFHDSNDGWAYFNFDLSSIPTNSTITQATLVVYNMANDGQDCSGVPTTLTVSLADSSWSENGITWNNKPGSAADNDTYMSCYNGAVGLEITSLIQQISDGSKTNNGFYMHGSGANFKRTLFSRETQSSFRTHLEVIYTPAGDSTPTPSSGQTRTSSSSDQSSSQGSSQGSNDGSSDSTAPQEGITAGTNQAPSTNVSSSIKPPSALTIKDAADNKRAAIKLSWKKSVTSGVNGYRIFRSEKEEEGFVNIASSNAETLTFTDEKIVSGKTYYYFVRAYKETEESSSSNTVSLKSQKLAESAGSKSAIRHTNKDWLWIGLGFAALMIVGLIIILITKIKKKPAKKPVDSSTHSQSKL